MKTPQKYFETAKDSITNEYGYASWQEPLINHDAAIIALKNQLRDVYSLISSDSFAIQFQSLRQYREALLDKIGAGGI